MTIYVDDMYIPKGKHRYCHLMSDTGLDELYQFAQSIGLKRDWLHNDHYDVTEGKRALAVRRGAKEITPQEMAGIRKKLRQARRVELMDITQDYEEGPGEGVEMCRWAYGVEE